MPLHLVGGKLLAVLRMRRVASGQDQLLAGRGAWDAAHHRHRLAVVRDDANLNEATLRDFLAERLVDYQRPRQIVFMDALPRNAMGKVLRREIQERMSRDNKTP